MKKLTFRQVDKLVSKAENAIADRMSELPKPFNAEQGLAIVVDVERELLSKHGIEIDRIIYHDDSLRIVIKQYDYALPSRKAVAG